MANLQANASGILTGSFEIPPGVPAGTKAVRFEGSGGSKAGALYSAQGWRTTVSHESLSVFSTVFFEPPAQQQWGGGGGGDSSGGDASGGGADPVAQTFRLAEARQICGVSLKFTHRGDAAKITRVQIREVDPGGPSDVVVAQRMIDMSAVTVVDPLSLVRPPGDWTRVTFSPPVTLLPDRDYAITALTADGLHEVAIADLAGFDQVAGWTTQNAFPGGTFLDGSDGRIWLPKPGRSLTFRLHGATYPVTSKVIEVGTVPVAAATDLLPLLIADIPAGTAVEVEFEAPDGTRYRTGIARTISLPTAITGDVKLRLHLRGTATLSPIVRPFLQFVAGALQPTGRYITRAFAAGPDSRVRAILDVHLPSTSSIAVSAQTGEAAGLPTSTAMTLERATPLGDSWEERQYVLDNVDRTETRITVDLAGGPAARLRARNVRAVAVPMT